MSHLRTLSAVQSTYLLFNAHFRACVGFFDHFPVMIWNLVSLVWRMNYN